ncbi:tRNA pseudouridine synthase-like 1 isoform X1 [Suricata suricatta]|uniref:tRNA pseudouridine synthase-like 1 isoform X1 n=1 Tax=Suricata suricatta TaxID=37032 RepID=UPI0011557B56|nr:tRNA pseudouridine synthase-like 1 isoform X1 [Suricata suricatta]
MVPAAGSMRTRYLVYFQYLGTEFNGVAAIRGSQRAIGVQNYLEVALSSQEAAKRLKSVVPVKFTISSRTDAGVHALSNAAHLDIQRRSGQTPFSPDVLTEVLNAHLGHPAIRVLQAFRVPSDFHARHAATSRTYLYRLATGCQRHDQLSVFERNRCWALRASSLDIDAMQEAAQHLLGTHDFSAFQSAGSPATSSVRTLRRASVSPDLGSPFVLPQENRLQFWNLEFESQSFLYRQVRRMTAVLVAVGLGALMPAQVKGILESRDPLGRHQTRVAPAHGLFLKSVQYGSLGGNPACVQRESQDPGGFTAWKAQITPETQLRSDGHDILGPAIGPCPQRRAGTCTWPSRVTAGLLPPMGPYLLEVPTHLPGCPGLPQVGCCG